MQLYTFEYFDGYKDLKCTFKLPASIDLEKLKFTHLGFEYDYDSFKNPVQKGFIDLLLKKCGYNFDRTIVGGCRIKKMDETEWNDQSLVDYLKINSKDHSIHIENDPEPDLIYCTMRDGYDEFDTDPPAYIDLECRFTDDQKWAPIRINSEFPKLARKIHDFLNNESKKDL